MAVTRVLQKVDAPILCSSSRPVEAENAEPRVALNVTIRVRESYDCVCNWVNDIFDWKCFECWTWAGMLPVSEISEILWAACLAPTTLRVI